MNPILYESTETSFQNNGIGVLRDAITCKVKEERNGTFELEMTYPITGIHYGEISLQRLILAKPNQTQQTQPFRIYRITKPMNGIVTVYGEHISYDLSGIAISPFSAENIQSAFVRLKQNAVGTCLFTFSTDKTTQGKMTVSQPCSLRSQLGGKAGSILDVYGGGEYLFDRYSVRLFQNRGANHGVSIRYGKNLTDIKQEENCSKVYSAVYPYWVNSETGVAKEITGKIVNVGGTFPIQRILTYDLTQEFQTEPTEAQMIAKTQNYIANNNIGIPTVNLDVSFVQLEQTEEYKGMALLERVSLCDTVNVFFPKLGVNATAKAVSLTYDVLLNRVESVSLGDAKTNITDTILQAQEAVENVPSSGDIASMISLLTSTLIGANGGSVRLLDTNGDGEPDTLYIADDPDPTKAVKVWRFNYQGWGASTNGYQGPYTMGATLATGLVAEFITAGYLDAARIKAHTIAVGKLTGKIENGAWILDLDNGTLTIGNISANNINTGTLSADRIGANSITVSKLTGTIASNGWTLDLTNGTLTIGNISADNINAGTLAAARIAAGSITFDKLTASTANGDGIVKLDGTGMEVSHSGIGTRSKSTLKSDGLKVYDASGNLVGGLYIPTGQSVAKMGSGSLFNPAYPNFSVQLERFFNGEDMTYYYGLALYRKNVRICGLAAPDIDNVDDAALIGYNNWLWSLNDIISTVREWSGYYPDMFIRSGESETTDPHLIYAHGRANVSSSQLRSVDYSAYGFTEVPTVVAQYSQTGSNISGDVGALKIYNKTATGFNMIIGGAQTQPDRDIDWIAIGIGTGKKLQND